MSDSAADAAAPQGATSVVERWRHRVGLWGAPLVAAGVLAATDPGPRGRLAALFAATSLLWITEAIPPAVTALLAVALSVVIGVATPKDAFAALGNPVLFLFVGGFMIAEAMHLHGLGARFAVAMTRRARGRLSALILCSSAAFLTSMWMSNAASTALLLPIVVHIADRTGDKRYAAAMVLAVAWSASMGGLATPVGTPPNLIGMRALADAGHRVDFLGWMAVGLPTACAMLVVMWGVLSLMFGIRRGHAVIVEDTRGPWSRGEVAACAAFGFAVVGWILPGVLIACGVPFGRTLQAHLPEEVVAVLGAGILFIWPIHARGAPHQSALSWSAAVRIDWGTVLLFGGGILLGDLANKTGLTTQWGEAMIALTGASTTWSITALVTLAALVLSELASNTAAATLTVPLALALAQQSGTSVVAAVVGATLGSSFGFMMPISTAPNAMAFGTGRVSIRAMMRTGIIFDVVGYVVVVIAVLLLAPLVERLSAG